MPALAALPAAALRDDVRVIGVDEAQFFPDLVAFCEQQVEQHARIVYVAGLVGDFRRSRFGHVRRRRCRCRQRRGALRTPWMRAEAARRVPTVVMLMRPPPPPGFARRSWTWCRSRTTCRCCGARARAAAASAPRSSRTGRCKARARAPPRRPWPRPRSTPSLIGRCNTARRPLRRGREPSGAGRWRRQVPAALQSLLGRRSAGGAVRRSCGQGGVAAEGSLSWRPVRLQAAACAGCCARCVSLSMSLL